MYLVDKLGLQLHDLGEAAALIPQPRAGGRELGGVGGAVGQGGRDSRPVPELRHGERRGDGDVRGLRYVLKELLVCMCV